MVDIDADKITTGTGQIADPKPVENKVVLHPTAIAMKALATLVRVQGGTLRITGVDLTRDDPIYVESFPDGSVVLRMPELRPAETAATTSGETDDGA